MVNNIKDNYTIYKNIKNWLYLVILASQEIVLERQLCFWSNTINVKSNVSYHHLIYIMVVLFEIKANLEKSIIK